MPYPETPITNRVLDVQTSDVRMAINLNVLSKHSQGNMAFSLALLQELENSAQGHLETLQNHAATNNLGGAGEAAHSLKGAAAIIGAEHLVELAEGIEASSSDGDIERVKILVLELQLELSRCLEQIPQIRALGTGSPERPL